MKTQTKPTPPIKQAKIDQLEPTLSNFQLYFQIESVLDRNGDTLHCRIVDDTGIVQAYFNKYAKRFDTGGVYLMTNLKCCLVDGCLRVEMSQNTVVSKEPDIIGFKDKSNDVSKRIFEQKKKESQQPRKTQLKKQPQPVQTQPVPTEQPKIPVPEITKRPQGIIPLTKEEALQQLRIGQQLYNNRKSRYTRDIKRKDHFEHKQGTPKQQEKEEKNYKKYEPKQDNEPKDKNQSKNNQHKPQYKLKKQNNEHDKEKEKQKEKEKEKEKEKQKQKYIEKEKKEKGQEKFKEQGRLTKAKSLMYKQKKEDNKQYKQDKTNKKDDKAYKNGNKKTYDKHRDYQVDASEIDRKLNKYKLKQEPKQAEVKTEEAKVDPLPQSVAGEAKEKSEEKPAEVAQIKEQAIPQPINQQDKKQNACVNINQVSQHMDNHVNLRVWITQKAKTHQNTEQTVRYIADSSGGIWLKTTKINLQPKQCYEIDNLQVCKEQDRIYLKQTEISQARRLQGSIPFNLRDINSKQ